jgi:hypothetical protein
MGEQVPIPVPLPVHLGHGKLGGRLPLATTCSKVRSRSELSKYLISVVLRSIVPTITRVPPWLSLPRSISSARVRRSGPRLVDARTRPRREQQLGVQPAHAGVAQRRQRTLDRARHERDRRRGEAGNLGEHRQLVPPQRLQGCDRLAAGTDRDSRHRCWREPGPLIIDSLEHAELVGRGLPAVARNYFRPKDLVVALRCHPENQLILVGAILSTLSSSPLLVVTYSAPSGPVRAARSRP